MNTRADIVVVGSGAAGIAAAVTAARSGCSTLLLDQDQSVGGIGGHSGLTTLCGLFDDAGHHINEGFAREFADALAESPPQRMGRVWVLHYRPQKFCEEAERLFASAPKLRTKWRSPVREIIVSSGRIAWINGIEVGAVIDCTGTAEVARAAGAECLATDETTQAAAVVFSLRNVTRRLDTAADLAAVLLPLARAGFPPVAIQPNLEPGCVTVKFTGDTEQAAALVAFLHQNIEGFEDCAVPVADYRPSQRAGRMIVGRYVLTGDDVLSARKFPDAVSRCCWPIEQWDANGICRYRYPPAADHYEIPARCLRAASIENLFMAGKTISADVDAIASARVMGCCLATGEAAAKLALASLKEAA